MENLGRIVNIWYLIIGFITGFIEIAVFTGNFKPSIILRDYFPVMSVVISIISVLYLMDQLNEMRLDRKYMKEEDERERNRIRLKEQLEGLYSPLLANRDLFVEGNYENTKETVIDPFMKKYQIKEKYEYLASNRLRPILREYFKLTSIDIKMNRDNWKELMKRMRGCIDSDFHYLLQEYTAITKTQFSKIIEKTP